MLATGIVHHTLPKGQVYRLTISQRKNPAYFSEHPVRSEPLPAPIGPDPDVIARAHDLLRDLERATLLLTDVLDVTGFPEHERRSDVALLSTVASGLPPITLDDLLESLLLLAVVSGPTALFPEEQATLSVPDEAHELLYLVEPLVALGEGHTPLPKHAGARLRAAPLWFSLTQPKTGAALHDVAASLDALMRLPLRPQELTTLDDRSGLLNAEPVRGAAVILLGALIFALAIIAAIASLVASGGILPFDIRLNHLIP
jgi:hypothetical protein